MSVQAGPALAARAHPAAPSLLPAPERPAGSLSGCGGSHLLMRSWWGDLRVSPTLSGQMVCVRQGPPVCICARRRPLPSREPTLGCCRQEPEAGLAPGHCPVRSQQVLVVGLGRGAAGPGRQFRTRRLRSPAGPRLTVESACHQIRGNPRPRRAREPRAGPCPSCRSCTVPQKQIKATFGSSCFVIYVKMGLS